MAIDPCAVVAPVRGIVRFVPADFKAAFPEFATVTNTRLQMNFDVATTLLNNSCGSVVCDAALRERLLNYLTAHVTALFDGVNGAAPSGAVGRVSDAHEGSVGARFDMGQVARDQAWFEQTQWGATFWAMTINFRSFQYIPPPLVCADYPAGVPWGPGWDGCGCD